MDDRRFDALTRRLGTLSSRRSALKGLVGLGGILTTGAVIHGQTDAARRGFSGPSFFPTPTPTPACAPFGELCSFENPGACCSRTCAETGGPIGPICYVAEPLPCQVPTGCITDSRASNLPAPRLRIPSLDPLCCQQSNNPDLPGVPFACAVKRINHGRSSIRCPDPRARAGRLASHPAQDPDRPWRSGGHRRCPARYRCRKAWLFRTAHTGAAPNANPPAHHRPNANRHAHQHPKFVRDVRCLLYEQTVIARSSPPIASRPSSTRCSGDTTSATVVFAT